MRILLLLVSVAAAAGLIWILLADVAGDSRDGSMAIDDQDGIEEDFERSEGLVRSEAVAAAEAARVARMKRPLPATIGVASPDEWRRALESPWPEGYAPDTPPEPAEDGEPREPVEREEPERPSRQRPGAPGVEDDRSTVVDGDQILRRLDRGWGGRQPIRFRSSAELARFRSRRMTVAPALEPDMPPQALLALVLAEFGFAELRSGKVLYLMSLDAHTPLPEESR